MNKDRSLRRVILAAAVGNALEYYDFIIYGYFAAIFLTQFFPAEDPLAGLMMTYGVFATGFLMRPLGALVLGHIGDRWGRKKALEVSILLMVGPTIATGLLPTYHSIGFAAPLLLLGCRMLQGFSVGGEIVGSYSYVIEHSPPNSRGLMGSWSLVGLMVGKLAGAGLFLSMSFLVSDEVMAAWAWRIPFLLGVLFALVGWKLRRRMEESPVFEKLKRQNKQQGRVLALEAVRGHWRPMLKMIGLTSGHTVCVYLLFMFIPVYLKTQWGVPYKLAVGANLVACLSHTLSLPFMGTLSDRVGCVLFCRVGALIMCAIAYPLFYVVTHGSGLYFFAAHFAFGLAYSVFAAPTPSIYMELFPEHVRNTGAGIAYNLSVMVFGGMSPLIATFLIKASGDPLSPAYYLAAMTLVSALTLLLIPESQVQPEPKAALA